MRSVRIREWLDGAGAIVVNADGWNLSSLAPLVDGWDGERVRILVLDQPGDLGERTFAGASIVPAGIARSGWKQCRAVSTR